ncbi:methyltransferase domain-containing protein [Schumannella luteola]
MQCSYFDAGLCRSCSLMGEPYEAQLAEKQRYCASLVDTQWLPARGSVERDFRSKAKFAIGGTTDAPTLGILDREYRGVDLEECGVHTPGIRAAVPELRRLITAAGLTPYDVAAREGELKNILVTENPDGELMVRFVLRSDALLPALRDALPNLDLPVRVASANLLPAHVALLEGDEEILLTEADTLPMRVGGLTLHLGVRSFFQTNLAIAAALYEQAAAWAGELPIRSAWDLYCGVGGFALALARPGVEVLGVETSADAVASAARSAADARLESVAFESGDATAFAVRAGGHPDLVVVNPPRRGLDAELCNWLQESGVPNVIYSSCNPTTLARDLARMPGLRPVEGRVFDMFPQTTHAEVMVRLER